MRVRAMCLALVAAALVAASCSNSEKGSGSDEKGSSSASPTSAGRVSVDQPGVTDTEIRVGGVASVTNPLGGRYGSIFDGVEAYFAMVNAEGGVYGRELVLASKRDDQMVQNQTEIQAMISQDDVFAALPIGGLLFTGAQTLTDNGVPGFGWVVNPEWSGRDNLFGHIAAWCFECPIHFTPWLAQENDAKEVGVIAYGVAQAKGCADSAQASFEAYDAGAEVVFTDSALSFGTTDFSTQVADMKDAGVDFVVTCIDQNGVLSLGRELRKQGLDAPMVILNAYDPEFIAANAEVLEGSYVGVLFTPLETEDPPSGVRDYLRWIEKMGKEPSELSVVGWINADLFVRGLEAAGPDFTREKLIAALNEMTDYGADGFLPPIDWTKGHVDPGEDPAAAPEEECGAPLRITDGHFEVASGDPSKPFVCHVYDSPSLEPTLRRFG